ncbi:phosphatase PAP2 family protein [Tepidibacillus fermentans]|uniref:Undecaprenyl-diphosphatase n=1 Tax=Tepidibacillus fermentans TaxID=1281767 RepID=A0A4R3KDY2_9BACI|nr:phosphatase PAP2 family protein [Tepidibacillus fermentans]TCS81290.1 undecaprenyl-diphosphatase [Tepidibacillus fermentans]
MKQNKNFSWVFGIGLLLIFGLIAAFVSMDKVQWFDMPIIHWVQFFESPTVTTFMEFFTFVGSGKIVILIIILISIFFYTFLKHRTELVFFILVMLGSHLINKGLKLLFHRQRPSFHQIVEEIGYSFPSGHSMAAFTLYATISFLLWKHIQSRTGRVLMIFFAVVMILAIGISRIYLGVHYPSDVLGGYFASGAWFVFCVTIYQWYLERKLKR